jgi:hypothetical protein
MIKTIAAVLTAALIGAGATFISMKSAGAQTAATKSSSDKKATRTTFKFPLKASLLRFEIVAGKERKFAEWMNFLRAEREAAVETLEGEKMYFEAVFSDKTDGKIYAFWMIFNGEGGKPVEKSNHELDKKHLAFWNECIKKGSRKTFDGEFYLTPEFLDQAIAQHQETEKND